MNKHLSTVIEHVRPEDYWLESLIQSPAVRIETPAVAAAQTKMRLIRLDEINENGHQAYRHALANVYATLDPEQPVKLLYLLEGSSSGVSLYYGVTSDVQDVDIHEAMNNLRGALEGQLPGINFGDTVNETERTELVERFSKSDYQGVMLGTPTRSAQDDNLGHEEQNFQDLDRVVRAMQSGGGHWLLAVVSQPLARATIQQHLDAAYKLSSDLTELIRTSVQSTGNTSRQTSASLGSSQADGHSDSRTNTRGTNESGTETKSNGESSGTNSSSSSSSRNSGTSEAKSSGTNKSFSTTNGSSSTHTKTDNYSLSDTKGSSLGITHEISNKRAQHLAEYIDKQLINRLKKGLTKGLFNSALYFSANDKATYQRLENTLRSTYQGSESTLSPLQAHDLPKNTRNQFLRLPTSNLPQNLSSESLLFHSLHADAKNSLGSLLTADELAIVASLPENELKGIRRRKTVSFIVDLPDVAPQEQLDIGAVIDRGRRYAKNPVQLSRKDLNKHIFVTGVTGAGKTTTCLNLLIRSRLPFLVIEPAKTEYRELAQHLPDVDYYRPNGDEHQSLRINPFALVRKGQRIKSHAGFLKNVFSAVFPLEASMPMMVEASILAAYEEKGWDIDENEFLPGGDPFDPINRAWPTMIDMIAQLDRLIPQYGLGKEFEEKYRGSLVSRLRSLTDGTLGRVLNAPQSIDFDALLDRHVVMELEELQGGEEKALLMALLLGAINEAMRARHQKTPAFRQLTLIEEAHRLLSRPEPGDKTAALAVESFANMLAEIRKYGTGLIIADQIPAKLIPDIIKNTHCKIVHRLFAEDDRRAMGEAMMMSEEQRTFLPNLRTGEAVVFCGGWHGPAHAAIHDHAKTDNPHTADDFNARYEQQLWRERARYYPHFCRLGWLCTQDENPSAFAAFVRETRQAQNQLLQLLHLANTQPKSPRAENIWQRLRQWHMRWQPRAPQQPDSLLAAAWMALLLDGNPCTHPQSKNVPPFTATPNTPVFSQQLMQLFAECKSSVDFFARVPECRITAHELKHLAHFKTL